ncbi:Trk system potassium transporter TrkA [Herbinix luporum]|jgi:trk system potassium uptake protein TrkA|uniref:Trk system potassium uptake protein TrkA n=1 Tax=Herbinix luporum TaxID=1679721 RepID=A0A0K8J7X8_9FIRM|nr:Trk system potassium transporter TrkA [Herbinix luporum]MDI9488289.1 Trk system potassium transporter TrkA [Bacillota bacterium]CUH93751.1 hypothetical protein SD1D_2236 [Herbinix luporum]HHT57221.1 Trk system potassium transporter TrkA [Herbinix luporum]
MNIIIVGCGKVGATLAEQLSKEGHDIVVVDKKSAPVISITETLDIMGIVGSGTSYRILIEAGIEKADLLIAVTGSDELNLLCCLIARKASKCHTVARVRNPQYNDEIDFIREEMALSMTINPELETALEMERLIKIPSAVKIEPFAKGKVELLKFHIPEHSILDGMKVMDLSHRLQCKLLACVVERGEEVYIPSGSFELRSKDTISIIATPENAIDFFQRAGILINNIKNVMIIGGSTIAEYLAQRLSRSDINLKIIEQNLERCEELSELLPHASIINANATDRDVLLEEGIEDMDAFAAITNFDEENIILSLYAKKHSHAKIFTKITRLTYDDIIADMPLGIIINPQLVTADSILQHARTMENPTGCNVEVLYRINDKVEALEFYTGKNAKLVGIPIEELSLKPNILICGINRYGEIIIPTGKDYIEEGDTVIIVTTNPGLNDLNDIIL